jgi:HAE1 family hydrophobic/amphiphilic exporter-1
VFAASAVVFVVGMGSLYLLGRETIPQADEGELFASVVLPVGTRLEVTNQALSRFEGVVRDAVPEAEYITVTGGSSAFGGGTHRGNIRVRLLSKRSRTTEEVAADLRRRLQAPGVRVNVRASSGALGFLRFGGGADPVEIEIRGFDLRQGMTLAQQVRETLETIPGITDATVAREEQLPEVVIRVDGDKAAALGLTPPQIAAALRTAVSGEVATTLRAAGRETDIVVRHVAGAELTEAQVRTLPIITSGGRRVLLGQVAELTRGESPTQIARRSRQRIISVDAGISGRDFGSVMADVRPKILAIPLPEGFSITFGEAYEEQQNAYRQLGLGFLVAVLLVYAVMAVQFERLLEPLLIMGSVPFALSGALLTLFLTGTTLNIQSLIGLIVLTGVIVNNAILLITFILQRREEGLALRDAAVEGATLRLRPVLMTTATTVMGLLPTAIGIGEGAELQVPLARAVLGGLMLGTLVTLVFIPTLYVSVEGFRVRRRVPRAAEMPAARPAPVAGGENGHHHP